MIGKTILHYKIVDKLGEGGMGVVYKAEDTKLERTVAIKFLPRHINADEEARKRFHTEAKAAAALNHPNIATIHAIEEAPLAPEVSADEMFIVMEYIEGQELKNLAKVSNLRKVLDIATQIASGLQAAHKKGVVHRDIKSANIMLTENGQVKITDFGLAKLSGHAGPTQDGTTVGTVAYMSPEQALAKAVDQRTDIWSFGVVLHEFLSGQLPFQAEYEQAILYVILHEEPEPLSSLRPDIPLALSNIVRKALQKEPEERYQSMHDIILDLKKVSDTGVESTHHDYDLLDKLPTAAKEIQQGSISQKGERRQVAIVVSTLSGYDDLVDNLARNDVNEIMTSIAAKATEIVNSHKGLVNQFTEDEIVLLFGIPVTHEDDLRRAAAAALELHDFIRQLNEDISARIEEEIQIHSGIDSGLIIVQPRDGSNRRFKLTGEAKQIASKLAADAREDQILISPKSRQLIQPFFDTASCSESFMMRGSSQPLTPFVIRGESVLRARFEAIEDTKLSSFTEREKELETLTGALKKAIAGRGQFVTIVAEAGLGKSRLLHEFSHQLDDGVDLIQASCHSHARNIPYFPFIGLLRELLGMGPEDDHQNEVETVVTRIFALDPQLEVYIPQLLQLLSLTHEKYALPDHIEIDQIQQAIAQGISAIVTMAANKKPLVILIEDWHWVDELSQDVLKQLADLVSDLHLCLVVTYRPDVVVDWGNPAAHTQIQLTPLENSGSAEIVKSVLGVENLPDELTTLIHERTGGNPFFIEELSQTLQEGGAISIEEGQIQLTDSERKLDLPLTIQAVIRSRLDRLNPECLEVLRVASVVGREFTQNIVTSALSDKTKLQDSVKALRDLGLIRQIRVLPEATFRFKHAMTQEVVYDSLLKRQRKALHGRIGEILEKTYDDRPGDHATRLMEHFSLAEYWEKATHYGCQAADSLMGKSFAIVLSILERVDHWIAKLPKNDDRNALLIDVLLKMERTSEYLGRVQRQKQIIERVQTLIEPNDIFHRAEVYIRLGDLCLLSNRLEEAENALMEACRLSQELGHEETEMRALRSLGYLKVQSGRDDEAIAIIRKVIEMGSEKGTASALVQDLNSLFTILIRNGDYEGAKKCVDDALELYDQVTPRNRTYINFMGGNYYRQKGDYDKAITFFRTMVQNWEELGITGRPTVGWIPLAHIYMIQGNVEEALRCHEKAVAMTRKAKIASDLAVALYEMGKVLVSLGRHPESLSYLEEAAMLYGQLEDSGNETQVLCTIAKTLEKDGKVNEAFSSWEKVRRIANEAGNVRIELSAVKGMANTTRNLAEDATQALKFYEEALELGHKLNDLDEQGGILNSMGIIEWQAGHYEQALQHYEKALEVFLGKDDKKHAGFMLNSMASTLIKLNRHELALARLQEAIQFHKQADQPLLEGHALAMRGDICLDLMELERAKQNYENSLELRQKVGDRKGEGCMMLQLAKVFEAQGLAAKGRAYAKRALTIAKECEDAGFLEEVQVYIR